MCEKSMVSIYSEKSLKKYDSKIIRDTIILTLVQIFLEIIAMIINMFISGKSGASATGITSLANSFFGLASVIAGGNIFICMSRFAAAEKEKGNPSAILTYGIIFSMLLSFSVSFLIFIFGGKAGEYFLKSKDSLTAIRLLTLCLPVSSVTSCMKGYFNAYRKAVTVAFANVSEFISRSAIMIFLVDFFCTKGQMNILTASSLSILCGEVICFLFLITVFHTVPHENTERSLKGFNTFLKNALPLTLNSFVTVILSGINEALLPFTLNQYQNNSNEALSIYGVLETVVMPLLYFPSILISGLSGILVPEISSARSSGDNKKADLIIKNSVFITFCYSIFAVCVIYIFGDDFGYILSNDSDIAGTMIKLLSFVIPFIYLEIVLESIIKAEGLQKFSSFNYIVEYAVRISVLLIFVPMISFYGIILSYYLSNIVGNIARMVVIYKRNISLKCDCVTEKRNKSGYNIIKR